MLSRYCLLDLALSLIVITYSRHQTTSVLNCLRNSRIKESFFPEGEDSSSIPFGDITRAISSRPISKPCAANSPTSNHCSIKQRRTTSFGLGAVPNRERQSDHRLSAAESEGNYCGYPSVTGMGVGARPSVADVSASDRCWRPIPVPISIASAGSSQPQRCRFVFNPKST
jgi:hypothetical protein